MKITSFKQVKHIYITQTKYFHQDYFKAFELSYEPVNMGQKKKKPYTGVYLLVCFNILDQGNRKIHSGSIQMINAFCIPL